MKLASHIAEWKCSNKSVLVRADLNVPLSDGVISNDMRLRAIQPTIDLLIKKKAAVILLTHLGRPHGHDDSLSTQHLIPWFKKHNYSIEFAATLEEARAKIAPSSLVLFENLRFFPEEKNLDPQFANNLAQLGEFFVQDAFGALHRNETSITLLPEQFPSQKRTIGLLIQKELSFLEPIKTDPDHPFCVIIGGAKLADKIPLIEYMQKNADHLLLCPAIAFTFLKAQEESTGASLVDTALIESCKKIIEKGSIVLPTDFMIAQGDKNGPLSYTNTISNHEMGISIGPETVARFSDYIQNAKTIFFNGAIGFPERPETLQGMRSLFEAMASSSGLSIVAGGDSVAALEQFGIEGITHISAGGGATLMYLSGKDLPGLQPFSH